MNKITQAFGWTALISGVRFRIGSLLPPTRKGRRPCKVSTRFDGLRRPGYCITCCSIRRHESQGYCRRSDTITPVLVRFGVSGVGLELSSFTSPPLRDNGKTVKLKFAAWCLTWGLSRRCPDGIVSGALPNKACTHCFSGYDTHYRILHYTILHYTILYYTTLYFTTLHTTLHYTTLHYTTHYTTLHYTTVHYTTLQYITLHYTTLHYTAPVSYTHLTLPTKA